MLGLVIRRRLLPLAGRRSFALTRLCYQQPSEPVASVLDQILDEWSKENFSSASDDTQIRDGSKDETVMGFLQNFETAKQEQTSLLDILGASVNPEAPIKEVRDDREFLHKEKVRMEMVEALQPCFDAVNEQIATDKDMIQFTQGVIRRFRTTAMDAAEISRLTVQTPLEPPVCRESISVLLEFCLKSLVNDFGCFEEARHIFESLRRDSSDIETQQLYLHGCDSYVYVAMIQLVWQETSNVSLVANLLREMLTSGLGLDTNAKMAVFQIQKELYTASTEQSVVLLHNKRDANFVSNVTDEREKLETRVRFRSRR